MQFVRLLPVILSYVLIGAHFLRYQQWLFVVVSVAALGLLFVKKRWVVYLLQTGLVLAAVEWLGTILQLVQFRQSMGMEWRRMAVILGVVALLTLLSALVFRLSALRCRYGLMEKEQGEA